MPPRGRAAKADPLEALGRDGPAPVYAIDGEERVLVDEAVAAIRDAAVPAKARDFNLDVLSGKDVPVSRIVEAAQMFPAFAPRRLVLVQHADKIDAESAAELIAYLESPNPTTVLVLVADKLDARTKLYKALQKAGAVIRYSKPKPRDMPGLVMARAKKLGIPIEQGAASALADAVGTDVSSASQALEVLSLYVGQPPRPIRVDDVEAVVSVTREESIFALVDAFGTANRPAAIQGLSAMLAAREAPLRMLAMIARHYRQLVKARAALDSGAHRDDLPGLLGIPPFFVNGMMTQARRQPLSALVASLFEVIATDKELKGGELPDTRAMERLALRLLSGSAR